MNPYLVVIVVIAVVIVIYLLIILSKSRSRREGGKEKEEVEESSTATSRIVDLLIERQKNQDKMAQKDCSEERNTGSKKMGLPDIFWKEKEGKLEHEPKLLEEVMKLEEKKKKFNEARYGPPTLNRISWEEFQEIVTSISCCEAEIVAEFRIDLSDSFLFLGYKRKIVEFSKGEETIPFFIGAVADHIRSQFEHSPLFACLRFEGGYCDNGKKSVYIVLVDTGKPMFTSTRYTLSVREK